MSKKLKNIGITPTTKKNLQKQAVDRDISYQLHCEDILEHQAKHNTIVFKDSKSNTKVESEAKEPQDKKPTSKPKPKEKKKPDRKEPQQESFVEPEKEETPIISDIGDTTITKDERKGAFARAEPNIYTNNKVWQCRMFDKKENKLVETYWRTKQEAIVARDKLKC